MTKLLIAAFTTALALTGYAHAQEAKKGGLAGGDMKYLRQMAESNLAEVQAGKLGASKASSGEVKKFAQHTVDDHSKMLSAMRSMAKSKNVKDKELKAAAQKAAPEIEKHLEMAKSIQSSLK